MLTLLCVRNVERPAGLPLCLLAGKVVLHPGRSMSPNMIQSLQPLQALRRRWVDEVPSEAE